VISLSYAEKLLVESGRIFRETSQAIFYLRHVSQRKRYMNPNGALSPRHLAEREHASCLCVRSGKRRGTHGTGVRTKLDGLGGNGRG
jgi:hypothetical protein